MAQGIHIHARRDGKQHVAQLCTFTHGVAAALGRVVSAKGFVRRLGHVQLAVQQRFDGGAGNFGHGAAKGQRVVSRQQAGLNGRLAQQFGTGPLPQGFGRQPFVGVGQHDAIDLGKHGSGGVHGLGLQ